MDRPTLRSGATRSRGVTTRVTVLSAVLLVFVVLLTTASTALAEPLFVVTGRGYGHGIGLSQVGAQGFATQGRSYSWITSHYFSGTTVGTYTGYPAAKTVRVALDAADSARTSWTLRSSEGTMTVKGGDGGSRKLAPGRYFTFLVSGSDVKVFDDVNGDGVQASGDGFVFRAKTIARVTVQPRAGAVAAIQVHNISGPPCWDSPKGSVSIPDVMWRGSIRIVPTGSRVLAYNDVNLEDYLRGVVPRESPSGYKAEALKAQAVAARGYALCSMAPSRRFDVYCTTQSQVYGGYGQYYRGAIVKHEYASTNSAVSATAGQVVKYRGTMIKSYFFSNSGGRTESVQNVWGGSPVPYYTSVDDPYEKPSAYWRLWPIVSYSASDLRSRLLGQGLAVPRVLTDVVVTKRGAGGRVVNVLLKGSGGDDKLLTLGDIEAFRRAVHGHDHWIYITRSSITAPAAVQYGVPFSVKVSVSPGYTGNVAVAYGAAGAATLGGRSTAKTYRGGGYASIPGITYSHDILVWNGSPGSSVAFHSRRVRVNVARRSWLGVAVSGRSLTITANVRPVRSGLPVTFWAIAPGGKSWVHIGTSALSSAGTATLKYHASTPGTWSIRVATPASDGFVTGTSGAVRPVVK